MGLTFLLRKDPVQETLFKPSLFTYIQRVVAQILMYRWHQINHRMLAGSPYPSGPQSPVGSLRLASTVVPLGGAGPFWVGKFTVTPTRGTGEPNKPDSHNSGDQGIVPDPCVAGLGALFLGVALGEGVVVERPWRATPVPHVPRKPRMGSSALWSGHTKGATCSTALPVEGRGRFPLPYPHRASQVKSGSGFQLPFPRARTGGTWWQVYVIGLEWGGLSSDPACPYLRPDGRKASSGVC